MTQVKNTGSTLLVLIFRETLRISSYFPRPEIKRKLISSFSLEFFIIEDVVEKHFDDYQYKQRLKDTAALENGANDNSLATNNDSDDLKEGEEERYDRFTTEDCSDNAKETLTKEKGFLKRKESPAMKVYSKKKKADNAEICLFA